MKLFWVFCFVLSSVLVHAQGWVTKINDSVYKNILRTGLKIGDSMPDIPLGTVINNYTGKSRFSEFKGKLVILDFWTTWCSSCIDEFPKMVELQEKFGDKIQIFLVNAIQTRKEIEMSKKNFKFPNLPCIVKDSVDHSTTLLTLFPARSTGHQVWIDGEGKIRVRGFSYNNTAEKINDLLSGKKIFSLSDDATTPLFDEDYPYVKLIGDFQTTPVMYSSLITPFNNEYAPDAAGGRAENVVDSSLGTRRHTYINNCVLNLYTSVFKDYLAEARKKILYGPHPRSSRVGLQGCHYFILPGDTLRYTTEFLRSVESDLEYVKPRYCYEQILPLKIPVEMQKVYMLQDLNRYFGSLYGTEVKLQTRKVPCFVLIRTSSSDKISSKPNSSSNVEDIVKYGVKFQRFTRTNISVLGDIISDSKALTQLFIRNNANGGPSLLLNETGFENNFIDIDLPAGEGLKTMEDLRRALRVYDLDIKKVERPLQFVVITDNSSR